VGRLRRPADPAAAGPLLDIARETGARFNFWHPDLVTLHLWLWYPNPDGLYTGTNPLVRPFNHS
jgi:hypothetical protein